jgi:hypothetical protein
VNEALVEELLRLRRRDESLRTKLAESGILFEGYSPEMEAVHLENAEALETILEDYGWPGVSLVGEEGAEAAWLIAQHAISRPGFQHHCLRLLGRAVAVSEAPAWQEAYLTDRIRMNEHRPQVYGTQLDWDAEGELSPWRIEAPADVDKRRAEVGLMPLAEAVELARQRAEQEGHGPPADREASLRLQETWARKVGWTD